MHPLLQNSYLCYKFCLKSFFGKISATYINVQYVSFLDFILHNCDNSTVKQFANLSNTDINKTRSKI